MVTISTSIREPVCCGLLLWVSQQWSRCLPALGSQCVVVCCSGWLSNGHYGASELWSVAVGDSAMVIMEPVCCGLLLWMTQQWSLWSQCVVVCCCGWLSHGHYGASVLWSVAVGDSAMVIMEPVCCGLLLWVTQPWSRYLPALGSQCVVVCCCGCLSNGHDIYQH